MATFEDVIIRVCHELNKPNVLDEAVMSPPQPTAGQPANANTTQAQPAGQPANVQQTGQQQPTDGQEPDYTIIDKANSQQIIDALIQSGAATDENEAKMALQPLLPYLGGTQPTQQAAPGAPTPSIVPQQ